jgi:Leucine-rich repeat (LRR) protein
MTRHTIDRIIYPV